MLGGPHTCGVHARPMLTSTVWGRSQVPDNGATAPAIKGKSCNPEGVPPGSGAPGAAHRPRITWHLIDGPTNKVWQSSRQQCPVALAADMRCAPSTWDGRTGQQSRCSHTNRILRRHHRIPLNVSRWIWACCEHLHTQHPHKPLSHRRRPYQHSTMIHT